MDALNQWWIDLAILLQSIDWLFIPLRAFTFLGQEEFFLLVMPALYWCGDAALGLRVATLIVASSSLNDLLKLVFHLPRPYWLDTRVRPLVAETSYGLPSGHAQNGVAVWGFLAAQLQRNWAWPAAIVLIGLISFSRLYLGVHFPLDLLGGWLAGALLLWAFLRWERPLTARLRGWGLWSQLGLALGAAAVYLVVAGGLLAALAPAADPPEWLANASLAGTAEPGEPAIAPRSWESLANSAGRIFGLGASLALLAHTAREERFSARGPWPRRLARFGLGLAGILVLWLGLRAVFPGGEDAVALAFRFLRYALIVIWALYVAPWVFLKTRLAEPEQPPRTTARAAAG